MQNFAKIFGSNVKHMFNEKVSNTLKSRGQLHPLLCEQLCYLGLNVPDFAPVSDLYDLADSVCNKADKGFYTKRLAKIIIDLTNAVSIELGNDKAYTLPVYFERAKKEKPETTETTETTIDQYDLLGSVGKITDPEILQEIIKIAQSRLSLTVPATV